MEDYSSIPRLVATKPRGRSRVTNGSVLFPQADGRTVTARRFRDLYALITDDLGGVEHLSEGQKQMVRRAAMLCAECERLESAAVSGDAPLDAETYGILCDRIGRLFGRIGLDRVAKVVDDPYRLLNAIAAEIAAEKESFA